MGEKTGPQSRARVFKFGCKHFGFGFVSDSNKEWSHALGNGQVYKVLRNRWFMIP